MDLQWVAWAVWVACTKKALRVQNTQRLAVMRAFFVAVLQSLKALLLCGTVNISI